MLQAVPVPGDPLLSLLVAGCGPGPWPATGELTTECVHVHHCLEICRQAAPVSDTLQELKSAKCRQFRLSFSHSVAGLVLERQRRISSPWTLSRTFLSWIPIIISCITVLMNVPRLSNLLSPLPYLAMYLKLTSRLYNINPRGKFLLEQLKTSHTNINLMQCLPFRTNLLETEKYRIWNFHYLNKYIIAR